MPATTSRTRLRRLPARGDHDRATIDAILDEALISHMGFVHDDHPVVVPTLHARVGDEVLLHGSAASRALRTLAGGAPLCLTVTLVDGDGQVVASTTTGLDGGYLFDDLGADRYTLTAAGYAPVALEVSVEEDAISSLQVELGAGIPVGESDPVAANRS